MMQNDLDDVKELKHKTKLICGVIEMAVVQPLKFHLADLVIQSQAVTQHKIVGNRTNHFEDLQRKMKATNFPITKI